MPEGQGDNIPPQSVKDQYLVIKKDTGDLDSEKKPFNSTVAVNSKPEVVASNDSDIGEERRIRSQLALAAAFGDFARPRGKMLSVPFGEEGVESESINIGQESLNRNHALLEHIGEEPTDSQRTEPAYTVCIPVAILMEDPAVVEHTVGLVRDAQQKLGKPVEVILWTNAKYKTGDEQEATEQQAQERYQALKERLANSTSNGEGLRIQTALQVLPQEEASQSKLRANYMDALAVEGQERGYSFEHPVIWLDADTTFLAKDSLKDLAEGVRNFDALVLHGNTQFSAEWAKGKKFSELDDATKAMAVREIYRRQLVREHGVSLNEDRAYPEESGLAFALGTYLKAGGLNTRYGADETKWLIYHAKMASESMPQFLLDENPKIPEFQYIKSARIGTSGRGHYEIAKQKGALGLVDPNVADHRTFTGTDHDEVEGEQEITQEDMYELLYRMGIEDMENDSERFIRVTPQEKIERREKVIENMVEKYFKPETEKADLEKAA